MPSAVVGVELIGLAVRLERILEFRDLRGRRRHVVPAEQPEQRAGQVPGALDERLHAPQRMALRRGPDHEAAIAVDGGVERQADRGQERVPTARAVADHADPAVGVTQPAQIRSRTGYLADDPLVWDGDRARRPRRRHRVVRGRPGRLAVVEVRHHRVETAGRERAGELLGLAVVSGQVVDDHHAADRAGLERPGRVRLDLVAVVPGDRHGLGQRRVIHRPSSLSWYTAGKHDVTGRRAPSRRAVMKDFRHDLCRRR
jgi:hypothetical protein